LSDDDQRCIDMYEVLVPAHVHTALRRDIFVTTSKLLELTRLGGRIRSGG